MRDYAGISYASLREGDAATVVPRLRSMLGTIDYYLRDISRGMGRIQNGEVPDGSGTSLSGVTDHGLLTGLADDDHTQYLLLAGRSGGQTAYGGTGGGDDLTLLSTSNATKGSIFLGTSSVYQETDSLLGIATLSPVARVHAIAKIGSGTFLPNSVVTDGFAGPYTGAGGTGAGGTKYDAVNSNDDDTLYIGRLASPLNGTTPIIFGLNGTITPGLPWIVSVRVRTFSGTPSSTITLHLYDSTGARYSATALTPTLTSSWTTYQASINGAGASSGSGTANSVELDGSAGTSYLLVTYLEVAIDAAGTYAEAGTFQSVTGASGQNILSVRGDVYSEILFRVLDSGRAYFENGSGGGAYLTAGTDLLSVYAKSTDLALLSLSTASAWSDTVTSHYLYLGDLIGGSARRAHLSSLGANKFDRFGISSTATVISDAAPSALRAPSTGSPTLRVENTVTVGDVVAEVRGMSGQTGHLLDFSDNGTVRAYHRLDGKLYISHPNNTSPYNNPLILLDQQATTLSRKQPFIRCIDPSAATIFEIDGVGLMTAAGIAILDTLGSGFRATITSSEVWTGDFDLFIRDLGSGSTQGEIVLSSLSSEFYDVWLDPTSVFQSTSASAGAAFQDSTTSSKKLRMVLSGAAGDNSFTLANSAARNYGFGNLSGNVVVVGDDPPAVASGSLGKVDLTGQTAAIGSTALSNTPPAGLYAVEVYAACTTASGSGAPTLDVTIGWTDVVGATTQSAVTALSLAATGRASGRVLAQVASGNITYSTTINAASGTPQYAVYIRVVALG